MALLDRWPSERRSLRDSATGVPIDQLTASGADHWPLSAPETPFTPDGESLLFLSDRAGVPHLDLFRLEMQTGTIEQLTDTDRLDPSGLTPAANARQVIASLRGDEGEVVAIDLETGDWETLAVFLGAELNGCHRSASGEYVVTVVNQEEEATITAVHTEGMRTVPVLTGRPGIHAARFSPDSKNSVLYVAALTGIHCVEFDGTGDRKLVSGVQAFGRSGVQGSSGTTTERLNAERLNAWLATWLGSGEEVLFVAGPGEGPLMAVPRRGGSPREISPLRCRWARSDASGERIIALASSLTPHPSSLNRNAIVLIDPHSGGVQPLCSCRSGEPRPCFSPDGQAVVYADEDEHGHSQLFLAFLDDTNRAGASPVVDLEPGGA
jgi:WD40-like Beta Propeller Repeat